VPHSWKFVAAITLAAASQAMAQTAPAPSAPDTSGILTLEVDNDAVSTLKGTSDQYYTSGLRLGWTSGEDTVAAADAAGQVFWLDGPVRLSVDLTQSLYTPEDTQIDPPNKRDRPYAGVLLANFGLIHDANNVRDIVSLDLGVVGPAALGETVQNGFHNIIGDTPNRGWSHQIGDQVAVQMLFARTWRLPISNLGPIELDALPNATLTLGDVRDLAQLGGTIRFGQGLDSDFGSPRITPGLNGADAFTATRPLVWYGFAGVDGQAVAYDVTLDGSPFHADPSVHKDWDVGEFELGAALIWHGVRVAYTQTWQTQEFATARSGLFNFGALTVSAKF
jgi:hypothetical protein